MRICTYNVHSWEDAYERGNEEEVADLLEGLGCDVIALQEVPSKRRIDRGALPDLAARLGMDFVVAPAGAALSNALLFRGRAIDYGDEQLEVGHRDLRSVAWATLSTPWGAVTFLATHLDDQEESVRLQQIDGVLGIARRIGTEAVILGDFNSLDTRDYPPEWLASIRSDRRRARLEPPKGDVVRRLRLARWVDLVRLAADAGNGPLPKELRVTSAYGTRVDYAWTSPLLASALSARAMVPDDDSSDHRAVVVDITPDLERRGNPRRKKISAATFRLPAFLATDAAAEKYALSAADLPDEEEDPEGFEIAADQTRVFARDFAAFARDLCASERFEVCRAIAVPRDAGWRSSVSVRCLGKSWSAKACGAGVYGRVDHRTSTRVVRLRGLVQPADVEWDVSLMTFVEYAHLEWEVRLKDDAPVRLIEVDGESLSPPVEGSAGAHGEDWQDGCAGAPTYEQELAGRRTNPGSLRRPTAAGRSDSGLASDAPIVLSEDARRHGDALAEAWGRGASKARMVWAMAAVADAIIADLDAHRLLESDEPEPAVGALRRWCLREGTRGDVVQARDRMRALARWASGPGGPWGRTSTGYDAIAILFSESVDLMDRGWSHQRSWEALHSAVNALTQPGEERAAAEQRVDLILAGGLAEPMDERRRNPARREPSRGATRAPVAVSVRAEALPGWVEHLVAQVDGVVDASADAGLGDAAMTRSHLADSGARAVGRRVASGETYGFIFEVSVPGSAQSRGVGRALMRALVDRLFAGGAAAIFLEAQPFGDGLPQEGLVSFYESMGFVVDPLSGPRSIMRLDRPANLRSNPPKGPARILVEKRPLAPGVFEIVVRAKARGKVVGSSVMQIGELDALLRWKERSGSGGWAAGEWRTFETGDVVGYLQNVSVEPDARGKGIGRSLMKAQLAAADEMRAYAVWLAASPLDRDTEADQLVAFYESLGFERMEGQEEEWSPSMVRWGKSGASDAS